MSKEKTLKLLAIIFVLSAILAYISNAFFKTDNNFSESKIMNREQSLIKQDIIAEMDKPVVQKVLYANNEVVGVVKDLNSIEQMIAEVKESEYESEFPDSRLGFGEDVFIAEEMLNFQYEDKDEEIKNFIVENHLLAIETNKVTFSNGAVIYVKNATDFEEAKEDYLLNFVSEEEMKYIKQNESVPYDTDKYQSTSQSIEIVEKTTLSTGYASKDRIYKDKREIIEFLSYGYGTDKEYYTVQAYDTIDGVAYQAGISAQQLITINPHLKSRDQLIREGDKLNVTFFDSPINVIVKKHTVKNEIIYPASTLFIEDETLKEGTIETTVEEESGNQKVIYEETYVNGQLKDGAEVLSTTVLKEPVQEIVKRGTMVIPSVGSGSFRYPVDNATITCGWYCYSGHTATDFQNARSRYGSVLASDRGVVDKVSYDGIGGYHVWIDHNNGYKSYYGHMNGPAYVSVGQIVERGEVLGQIGMTGLATGPHVHLMITYNGSFIDPMSVVGR